MNLIEALKGMDEGKMYKSNIGIYYKDPSPNLPENYVREWQDNGVNVFHSERYFSADELRENYEEVEELEDEELIPTIGDGDLVTFKGQEFEVAVFVNVSTSLNNKISYDFIIYRTDFDGNKIVLAEAYGLKTPRIKLSEIQYDIFDNPIKLYKVMN